MFLVPTSPSLQYAVQIASWVLKRSVDRKGGTITWSGANVDHVDQRMYSTLFGGTYVSLQASK